MKKIVPFKKEIVFKTNLAEITSISLEHTLHPTRDSMITGEFIVGGDYKMADNSTNTEYFSFHLPFNIDMDEHYILDDASVDINDFYYEIVNSNILLVNIEVSVDGLKEMPLMERVREIKPLVEEEESVEVEETVETVSEVREDLSEEKEEFVQPIPVEIEEEPIMVMEEEGKVAARKEASEEIKSLFDNMDDTNETYSTYRIYIVREEDTLEVIMKKYDISREQLEAYNNINELKLGDKLIIPASRHAEN